ncbi:MAG: FAD-dependent thymidylate synthase, partial [Elusimicrobiota bacterium]|nr:FAD-dependent thymidylate synthase [Elusimicrobiota bacterium]
MILIEPNVKYIDIQEPGKKAEYAGRVCYKSQDKITEDSHKKFLANIIKRGHTSILEHEYITVQSFNNTLKNFLQESIFRRWFTCTNELIHANLRAWYNLLKYFREEKENDYLYNIVVKLNTLLRKKYEYLFPLMVKREELRKEVRVSDDDEVVDGDEGLAIGVEDDINPPYVEKDECNVFAYAKDQDIINLAGLCEEYNQIKTFTFEIITDRAISHQLVRHRTFSFSQESQRYCNYNTDKFDHSVKFILPRNITEEQKEHIVNNLDKIEKEYFNLLSCGCRPENARYILPNATATTLIVSGPLFAWENFINLRN